MSIHGVSRSLALGKRLQVILGQLEGPRDARVNVVALLKIDVLKKIAAHASGGDGVAIQFDPLQLGNRALDRHQSLAKVFVDAGFYLPRRHRSHPNCRHQSASQLEQVKVYFGIDLVRPYFPCSRSLYLCSLPVAVLGSSSKNSTQRGRLKTGNRLTTNSCSSRARSGDPEVPFFNTTQATGFSSWSWSSRPMTAASSTAGCSIRTLSISIGFTHTPLHLSMSSERPTYQKYPSASR